MTRKSIYLKTEFQIFVTYNHIFKMKSCCPQGSWPQLSVQYQPKGTKSQVQGVSLYHVGQGHKALLIMSDIFGATSGRHQVVADIFASIGYNVFLPELLCPPNQGQEFSVIITNIANQPLEVCEKRFLTTVKVMESHGIKQFFSIGFCWGVWFAFKMAAKYEGFRAIVGPHPSLMIESIVYNKSQNALAENIKCPSYLLPAGNDPENVKNKGELIEILIKRFGGDKVGTSEFVQMTHGWVTRGDLKDEAVARDFDKAINLAHQYFSKFI